MGAGLDYNLKAPGIEKALSQGKTSTRELVSAISETVLDFESGTRFRYSLCHDVLGALIEVWSGKKLGDFMQEQIFAPLGMNHTFFGIPKDRETLKKIAPLYTYCNGAPKKTTLYCQFNLSEEYQSGGAGLVSCTADYARFSDALACGGTAKNGTKILSSASVELMRTNHLNKQQLADFSELKPGYGYGLGVRTHIDKTISGSLSPLGEFGWDGYAGGFSMIDPKQKLSLTYFQHIYPWDARIHAQMRNVFYSCFDS